MAEAKNIRRFVDVLNGVCKNAVGIVFDLLFAALAREVNWIWSDFDACDMRGSKMKI